MPTSSFFSPLAHSWFHPSLLSLVHVPALTGNIVLHSTWLIKSENPLFYQIIPSQKIHHISKNEEKLLPPKKRIQLFFCTLMSQKQHAQWFEEPSLVYFAPKTFCLWSHCWVYLRRIVKWKMFKRQGKHMEKGRVCPQTHHMLGHMNLIQDSSKAPVLLNIDMCIHFLLWQKKNYPGILIFLLLKNNFFLFILNLGLYILILHLYILILPRSSFFPHSPKSILLLILYC